MTEEQTKLVGRTFRHFKGNLYRLEGFAKDSETQEEMVVYRALYGEHGLWVRPAKMFFETIERDGKRMKRFGLVREAKDMTNKELRDRGELYDANYDPELVRLMDECKDKCWEYNKIKPSDWIAKDAKLREIIGSVGSGVRVQAPFLVRLWHEHHIRRQLLREPRSRHTRRSEGRLWKECLCRTQLRLSHGGASA